MIKRATASCEAVALSYSDRRDICYQLSILDYNAIDLAGKGGAGV